MGSKLHCILLVEDNFMTNLFNEKMLENLCVADHIVTAENGEEALKYLQGCVRNHTYPELVLVDIFMPGMSGWAFLEKFNQLKFDEDQKPAIVVLTHSHDAGNFDHALAIPGVIGYLNKPLTESDVMELLNQHFHSVVAHD
jgi:response regulator of citrate/malate metabolism